MPIVRAGKVGATSKDRLNEHNSSCGNDLQTLPGRLGNSDKRVLVEFEGPVSLTDDAPRAVLGVCGWKAAVKSSF